MLSGSTRLAYLLGSLINSPISTMHVGGLFENFPFRLHNFCEFYRFFLINVGLFRGCKEDPKSPADVFLVH